MSQLALAFQAASELPEPLLYHDVTRSGFVSLWTPRGATRQKSFRLDELPAVLAAVDGQVLDTYLTQHEFARRNRQSVNCKRLTSHYIDLDGYKIGGVKSPERQLDELLTFCDLDQIPPPTTVVHSGRGLQVKWVLEKAVPAAAMIRWSAVQQELCRRLEPLGADKGAVDASRVLRLVGTVNTRNGVVAREIYRCQTPTMGGVRLDSGAVGYSFDTFAATILPVCRAQIKEQRVLRKQLATGRLVADGWPLDKAGPAQASTLPDYAPDEWERRRYTVLNPRQLAWDRLADLRFLVQLRGWEEGVPEGSRDTFLYSSACFLSWTGLSLDLDAEMRELAAEYVPSWTPNEVSSALRSVYARYAAAKAGENGLHEGVPVDPRYRHSNAGLVERLKLAPHEQMQMKTIISKEEAARRDRDRHEQRRRMQGATPRAEYCGQSAERPAQARCLRAEGLSMSQIAAKLGVSKSAVSGYCQD